MQPASTAVSVQPVAGVQLPDSGDFYGHPESIQVCATNSAGEQVTLPIDSVHPGIGAIYRGPQDAEGKRDFFVRNESGEVRNVGPNLHEILS